MSKWFIVFGVLVSLACALPNTIAADSGGEWHCLATGPHGVSFNQLNEDAQDSAKAQIQAYDEQIALVHNYLLSGGTDPSGEIAKILKHLQERISRFTCEQLIIKNEEQFEAFKSKYFNLDGSLR